MQHDQLTQTLDTAIEDHSFSGVISIRQRGAVLYERASGYADRSNKIVNTMATRFGIASGTKFFTALAIGKLIEAGKLTFATKLNECITLDFAHYSPDITIGHLLSHTSGIADYLDEDTISDFDNIRLAVPYYDLRGPRDYLAIFPDEPMKFTPGEGFSYCNGGYILLGVVIEELTGMKYQDFVEQAILKPIGMHRSGFFAMNKLPEQTALGYIKEAEGWRTNIYNIPVIGASDGGAFTTVDDVATIWSAFMRNEILPHELVEIYTQPQVSAESEGPEFAYGYGIWIHGAEGPNRNLYIIGGDAGVSFKSILNRANDLLMTVISNTSDGAWPILRAIATVLP